MVVAPWGYVSSQSWGSVKWSLSHPWKRTTNKNLGPRAPGQPDDLLYGRSRPKLVWVIFRCRRTTTGTHKQAWHRETTKQLVWTNSMYPHGRWVCMMYYVMQYAITARPHIQASHRTCYPKGDPLSDPICWSSYPWSSLCWFLSASSSGPYCIHPCIHDFGSSRLPCSPRPDVTRRRIHQHVLAHISFRSFSALCLSSRPRSLHLGLWV